MNLMIVESPNKTKKIQQILGSNWIVSASLGHIRDLPKKSFGINPDTYELEYESDTKQKSVIARLRKLAKNAESIYLASDPDREGEAIAYHLKCVLNVSAYRRVTFNEISREAIEKALKNSTKIDMNLVYAQEGRRGLDRLVGYTISPILSKKSGIPLSAGRVQSPTLKIIYLREKQIKEFRTRNFYVATFKHNEIIFELIEKNHLPDNEKHFFSKEAVEKIINELPEQLTVEENETKTVKRNPPPPFTTSTLQQVANKSLGLTSSTTMKLAQSLFEKGLITYHRTDSPNLSDDAFSIFVAYWHSVDPSAPTQDSQIRFKSKAGAQEAHEAIRPVDPSAPYPDDEKEASLYSLIKQRALVSVLTPEVIEKTTVVLGSNVSHAKFSSSFPITIDAGFTAFTKTDATTPSPKSDAKEFQCGATLNGIFQIIEKKTTPPKPFTESSIIAALEKLEIGRPSTYASIIENLKKRKYITSKKGVFNVTDVGIAIVEGLEDQTFMGLDFTKKLENELDKIAEGKSSYSALMKRMSDLISLESKTIDIKSLIEIKKCPHCQGAIKLITKADNEFYVHLEDSNKNNCDVRFISKKEAL